CQIGSGRVFLHDALPICIVTEERHLPIGFWLHFEEVQRRTHRDAVWIFKVSTAQAGKELLQLGLPIPGTHARHRGRTQALIATRSESTRLNYSHVKISDA